MTQEELRQILKSYLDKYGSTRRFISTQTNIPQATLCHWEKKRRELDKKQFNSLLSYLTQNK